ncbi:hypothetical protein AN948_05255 [Rhodococcus sp. ADH]|nr:hypothetical protein AN948_05255 [Rhodococcus sp. ADH]RGP48031.1 hypothetical protein AWH04_16725 [Rhodococcus erythropolis]
MSIMAAFEPVVDQPNRFLARRSGLVPFHTCGNCTSSSSSPWAHLLTSISLQYQLESDRRQ